MLEKLDARVAASIDPNFSAHRTYFLDNAPAGLKVVGHDDDTGEDFAIPLIPANAFETDNMPVWNEDALLRRKEFNKKRRVLEVVATVSSLLFLIGVAALLLKGVD